jgi:hypothetical protein
MKTSADLIRKAGTQESGASIPCFFLSRFAICVRAADYRMVANDEARMSNNEGMTKIQMPNLRKSVQSADDHLRDLCVLCGEK